MSQRQRREASGTTDPGGKPGAAMMWQGTRFTLPQPEDYPLEAIEAEENGQILKTIELILGDEQYATFRSKARTAGDAVNFLKSMARQVGRGNP